MLLSLEHFWMAGWVSGLTIGLSDVMSVQDASGLHWSSSLTDGLGALDGVARGIGLRQGSSLLLADSARPLVSWERTLLDAVPLQDRLAASLLLTLVEEAAMSDSVRRRWASTLASSALLLDGTQAATGKGLSDTVPVILGRSYRVETSRTDLFALTDSLGKGVGRSFSDGVGSDDAFGDKSSSVGLREVVTSLDALSSAALTYRNISQAFGLVSAQSAHASLQLISNLSVQDASTAVLYRQLTDTLASTVGVTDATLFRLTTDLNTLVHVVSEHRLTTMRKLADQTALVEGHVREWGSEVSLLDTLGLGDEVLVGVDLSENFSVLLTDSIILLDSFSKYVELLQESLLLLGDTPLSSWFILTGYATSPYHATTGWLSPTSVVVSQAPLAAGEAFSPAATLLLAEFVVETLPLVPNARIASV